MWIWTHLPSHVKVLLSNLYLKQSLYYQLIYFAPNHSWNVSMIFTAFKTLRCTIIQYDRTFHQEPGGTRSLCGRTELTLYWDGPWHCFQPCKSSWTELQPTSQLNIWGNKLSCCASHVLLWRKNNQPSSSGLCEDTWTECRTTGVMKQNSSKCRLIPYKHPLHRQHVLTGPKPDPQEATHGSAVTWVHFSAPLDVSSYLRNVDPNLPRH